MFEPIVPFSAYFLNSGGWQLKHRSKLHDASLFPQFEQYRFSIYFNPVCVYPRNGKSGQCFDVQSLGCVSQPIHSIHINLIAIARLYLIVFIPPSLVLIVFSCVNAFAIAFPFVKTECRRLSAVDSRHRGLDNAYRLRFPGWLPAAGET